MYVDIKKCLFIGLSVAGTIIGVGFASGREVVSFFAGFGFWSLIMCFVASVFFAFLCFLLFKVDNANINHENKKCKVRIDGQKYNDKRAVWLKIIELSFNFLLVISQVVICSVMIAGVDEVFYIWGLSAFVSSVLKLCIVVCSCFYLIKFRNGVFVVNRILSFLMILLILVVFVSLLAKEDYVLVDEKLFSLKMLYLPIMYMGMNFFTAYPAIKNLSLTLYNTKERFVASFFIGLCVFVPLCLVCLSVLLFGGDFLNDVMIMESLATSLSGLLGVVYLFLVLLAIITTLLSTAFGAAYVMSRKYSYKNSLIFVLLVSYIISFLGFGSIIDKGYPLLGVLSLGLFLIKTICSIATKAQN